MDRKKKPKEWHPKWTVQIRGRAPCDRAIPWASPRGQEARAKKDNVVRAVGIELAD